MGRWAHRTKRQTEDALAGTELVAELGPPPHGWETVPDMGKGRSK